jgi:putative restriction endonuclease
LRERHGDHCLVTGCKVLAVLEAAHIKPYRGEQDNHPENGLLLRSDIHTLFDLDLLGIEPDRLQVELHPSLRPEYGDLAGLQLGCRSGLRPSREALRRRYKLFLKKLDTLA